MSLLDRVRVLLSAACVDHALIGAAALAVHGVSRSTLDQDLLVVDRQVLVPRFWNPLGSDVGVDIRTGDDDDPLAGVVRLTLPAERDVDLVVGRHVWQEAILAQSERFGPQQLPVVTAPDLILLKLYAGGSQDRWDIEQLLAIHSPDLARSVDQRIAALPQRSRTLWESLRPA